MIFKKGFALHSRRCRICFGCCGESHHILLCFSHPTRAPLNRLNISTHELQLRVFKSCATFVGERHQTCEVNFIFFGVEIGNVVSPPGQAIAQVIEFNLLLSPLLAIYK